MVYVPKTKRLVLIEHATLNDKVFLMTTLKTVKINIEEIDATNYIMNHDKICAAFRNMPMTMRPQTATNTD